MPTDFSEFSFGFAFTHEYVNRNPGLKAAPELPSLIKEAESGHDLKLPYQGHPKYFQFKLSTYLQRTTAIHWNDHSCPHYRVRLTTRPRPNRPKGTDQHSRLKSLAQSVDDVFYIAPRFHSEDEFNHLFLQGNVTDNSLWAPLKDLHWVSEGDRNVHYLTFTKDQKNPSWHSEATILEGKFTAEDHYATIREMVTIDEAFFRELRNNLRASLYGSDLRAPEALNLNDDDSIASVLRETYQLLTTQYGLQMVTLMEDGGQG